MSMRSLETAILSELKQVTGRNKLRVKDIMEWSTSEDRVRKGAAADEEVIHCPLNGVWCAIPKVVSAPIDKIGDGGTPFASSDGSTSEKGK